MTIIKPIAANGTVNGAAYINPNSLKIPPSTVQRVDSPAQNENLFGASGVLQERYRSSHYVENINIVSVSGVIVSATDLK